MQRKQEKLIIFAVRFRCYFFLQRINFLVPAPTMTNTV